MDYPFNNDFAPEVEQQFYTEGRFRITQQ